MSAFTMPLKKVIKLTGGKTEIVSGVTKLTGGNIGLQYYTIFEETYRDSLNGRIIDRYWNREIGQETIDMFQLAMRRKMNEIMPYYNKLYNSELIDYQALSTVDLRTVNNMTGVQESEGSGTSNATNNSTGDSRSVSSETPQTMLSGDADYATAASDVKSSSDTTSDGSQSSNEHQTSETEGETSTTGYQGAASDLIIRYRESLLNIDLMVIGELEELFMLVWDTGDRYTNTRRGYWL